MKRSILQVLLTSLAVVATSAASSPARADDTSGTASDGARQATVAPTRLEPNARLLASGGFTLGIAYGASIIVAASSDRHGDGSLYAPIVGPWLDLSSRTCASPAGGVCRDGDSANRVLLVLDGVLQGLGLAQIAGAFMFPTKRSQARPATASVHVAPSVGRMNGLTASATF